MTTSPPLTPSATTASASGDDACVLLVGGYGLVGSEIAMLLRERHPNLRLLLGGRNPAAGAPLASRLGHADAVRVDTTLADPLASVLAAPGPRVDLVATVVNDPGDTLLRAAVERGIALVDITRWTARMHRALALLAARPPAAAVVLASGWMGGFAPIVAAAAASRLASVETIFLDILYGMADRSGPDSVAYMDRLAIPFEALRGGEECLAWPLTDRRRAVFAGGISTDTWRLDTPEQLTLPGSTGAHTVETRIAFDSAAATLAMAAMARVGIFSLLQKPRLTNLRRALLHVSGPGATTRFTVEAGGRGADSKPASTRICVSDARGQAHLTAIGALLVIERVLDLDGAGGLPPGVHFPESFVAPDRLLATAVALGVELQ